ncbi:MAG: GNAT family N-acetyltransferase [Thiotrichales bacterium]|nr:MAG: GNAT family N-acetyltransferase [Thiotrichales bacterium]
MSDTLKVEVVDWHQQQDRLKAIRKSVFIDEQHVPKELEWDGQDAGCTQFLASLNSTPVATARLTSQGQIGRMAVLGDFRDRGIGSRLLKTVLDQAQREGHEQVFLHAQVNVINFYEKHGFVAEGDVFVDAGIDHISMRLRFTGSNR